MTRIFSLFMSVVLTLSLLAQCQSAEPVRLRVLCYNIHHAEGMDRQLDLERIARVVLSVQPDLVALQEVDQNAQRTGSVDQPAELAKLTNMQVVFGANIELQGGHYGNAVLSRFPIVASQNHQLPNVDRGEQRGVLELQIKLPEVEQPLHLLATHLDYRPDDAERVQSAHAINALVKGQIPALLMGDLNDVANSDTLTLLESKWQPTNDQPLFTIPVKEPKRQIDFILYRPAARWKVVETRVLEEAVASDHRAIFSVLELHP